MQPVAELAVEITRFVDEHIPGFVECRLVDASGKTHLFVEKVPIVTAEALWTASEYPRPGALRCEVEREWKDETGRPLVKVGTGRPDGVESTEGQMQFVVSASQVTFSK